MRPRTLRTLAWSAVAVALMGVLSSTAAVVVVAGRFAHLGAAARVAVPIRVHADIRMRGYRVHHVELEASAVDLSHLGQHTHANWVVFELPFDPAAPGVRNVRFEPRALRATNIAALPTVVGCVPTPTLGSIESRGWGEYTKQGTSGTRYFAEHPLVPTYGARVYAVNVPTRVANAAACWDPLLLERGTWRLDVSWEAPEDP